MTKSEIATKQMSEMLNQMEQGEPKSSPTLPNNLHSLRKLFSCFDAVHLERIAKAATETAGKIKEGQEQHRAEQLKFCKHRETLKILIEFSYENMGLSVKRIAKALGVKQQSIKTLLEVE